MSTVSVMMDDERHIRRHVMHAISQAVSRSKRCIERCRTTHLMPRDLNNIGIVLSNLEWHPPLIDLEPRFCEPYPSEAFEQLFKRTKCQNYHDDKDNYDYNHWFSKYNDWEEESARNPSDRRHANSLRASKHLELLMGSPFAPKSIGAGIDWIRCTFGRLYKSSYSRFDIHPPSRYDFGRFFRALPWPQEALPEDPEVLEMLKSKYRDIEVGDATMNFNNKLDRPGKEQKIHMAVVNIDGSPIDDNRLLRSEVIAALSVMYDQMKRPYHRQHHAIFPVFVYSWSGYHCRVLQVHIDLIVQKLYVRKTSYIEISSPDQEDNIKLMLRWMMNTPTGTTTWEGLKLEQKLPSTDQESTNRPPSPSKRSIRCE